jgi:uncharacterized protein (DUF427 family)
MEVEMSERFFEDEEWFFDYDMPLVEQIAENIAIYAGVIDDARFMPQAQQLLRIFEAIEGRPPRDYLEIEDWSLHHLEKGGRLLIVK